MIQKINYLIIPICLLFFIGSVYAVSDFDSDGYNDISVCSDLITIDQNLSSNFELIKNIDCTGTPINPIATATPFSGNFNGNGYTISNLSITAETPNVGLFASTNNNLISNLNLENVNITGTSSNGGIGGISGFATNTNFTNVSVSGIINCKGDSFSCGGIVGYYKNGNIIQSRFTGEINGQNTNNQGHIGGLVGSMDTTSSAISESYFKGNITSSNLNNIGGLIGNVISGPVDISNSFSSGNLSTKNGGIIAGLVINNSGNVIINNSYSSGIYDNSNNIMISGLIYTSSGNISVNGSFTTANFPGNGAMSAIMYTVNAGLTCSPVTEVCDEIDNDCDHLIDEGGVCNFTYYCDADSDGYKSTISQICTGNGCIPAGCQTNIGNDCNDSRAYVHPGAEEMCNIIDDDCDGGTDEDNVCVSTPYYCDADHDSYISSSVSGNSISYVHCSDDGVSCSTGTSIPNGCQTNVGNDCVDTNASIHPGATEVCDSIDNDCDSQTDEGVCPTINYYCDADSDTYKSITISSSCSNYNCITPTGCQTTIGNDCVDTNSNIHPGATEVCDSIDNDCDNQTDEGGVCSGASYYCDSDNDGYKSLAVSRTTPATGCVTTQGNDCNDSNPTTNPGITEACPNDNFDNDCDGVIDECPTAATCNNGHLDSATESGIDCGRSCRPCSSSEHCIQNNDCYSHSCVSGTCAVGTLLPLFPGINDTSADRMNIVFAACNFSDMDSFLDYARRSVDYFNEYPDTRPNGSSTKGLMEMSVYKDNKDKFNFWYVPYNLPPIDGYANPYDYWQFRPINAVMQYYPSSWQSHLWDTKIAVIANDLTLDNNFNSGAGLGGESVNSLSDYYLFGNPFNHEFQHQFPILADEYYGPTGSDAPMYPNCADTMADAQSWWGSLVGNNTYGNDGQITGYYYGCSYNPYNIRPAEDSIMGSPSISILNAVHQRAILEKLADYTGTANSASPAPVLLLELTNIDPLNPANDTVTVKGVVQSTSTVDLRIGDPDKITVFSGNEVAGTAGIDPYEYDSYDEVSSTGKYIGHMNKRVKEKITVAVPLNAGFTYNPGISKIIKNNNPALAHIPQFVIERFTTQ